MIYGRFLEHLIFAIGCPTIRGRNYVPWLPVPPRFPSKLETWRSKSSGSPGSRTVPNTKTSSSPTIFPAATSPEERTSQRPVPGAWLPIQPNLNAWLVPYAKRNGPVVELADTARAIMRLIDSTRLDQQAEPALKWLHNGLRHSISSYRLAIVENAAEAALEAAKARR